MPNLQNAKKALRQTKKKTALNRQYKNRIKKVSRMIDDAVKSGNQKEAEKMLPIYFKAIDKAAKHNIIHKNTASRRKSSYSKKAGVSANKQSQDKIATANNSQDK
ncbi:MAG: 30S ribosomal protein S20 [Candidatus Spechtbacterales bacterium]